MDTRPREVTGVIPPQTELNQAKMVELAGEYTKPKASCGYREFLDVKTLFQMAKAGGQKTDWKLAQQARKKAKAEWAQHRLDKAVAGDWVEVRRLRGGHKRGWETSFACTLAEQGRDPHKAIHEHLEGIFGEGPDLDGLVEEHVQECAPITDEEVLQRIGKANGGRAVGVDQTSKELLAAIANDPVSLSALREWFDAILRSAEVPVDWGKSVMIILPKVSAPTTVKDVRPIAMGSAVGKLFSRILLNRAMGVVGHSTAVQCAGAGRQTADYLYSIAKSFDLEPEWKGGTVWAKPDISKAFDTLSRLTFLKRLKTVMGNSQEFRCWVRMFRDNVALLTTPWDQTEVGLRRGVKQGAVESPTFFGKVVEWVFADAQARCGWSESLSSFPELPLPGVCYMDDGVVWPEGAEKVEQRLQGLTNELSLWGLTTARARFTSRRMPG